MSRWQPIYDVAQICSRKGLQQVVLCPGSRCAPLTLAFSRHPKLQTRTFSDERSAGFIALGMAQQTNLPIVMVCTSGSAAYNFAPAVAEAYFQQVPLLIFTADRPAAWIDQLDGQTIRQENIFGGHVKKSFNLPEDYEHPDSRWQINRTINEAINLAGEFPAGPVHINAPFREPLYPKKDEIITYTDAVRIVSRQEPAIRLSDSDAVQLAQQLKSFTKVLIVAGQGQPDEKLARAVDKFSRQRQAPVAADIISNLHGLPQVVRLADVFLGQCDDAVKKGLQPELLITFGKSVLSKNLKVFLRKFQPQEHWHIQPASEVADTFQSLTRIVRCSPADFFEELSTPGKKASFEDQKRENYSRLWEAEEHRSLRSARTFFSGQPAGELQLVQSVLENLPRRCNLHLANSMSVRYANFIGLNAEKKGVHVFANRGTSGIDGCTSTAVGHALTSEVPNVLITGDMAFFYDGNAFWHNHTLRNLHILVLNNHGGAIFGMIDGPADLPDAKEFFITRQTRSARSLAGEFGFEYTRIDNPKKIKNALKDFFEFDGKVKIAEFESDATVARKSLDEFKKVIRKGYEA